MPRYVITEKAGRFVAGHTNTGTGTILSLTKRAADHELRLGTILPVVSAEVVVAEPSKDTELEPNTSNRRRRRPIAEERHDD
ncbi:MAG: hypothetical protein B7Z29_20965 [Hyphomicrobium sp. 12-62-95]|nr:MAG: hypothetical protein B7Z29_20965 [Hyphomicrobium sp. 12-62-95]